MPAPPIVPGNAHQHPQEVAVNRPRSSFRSSPALIAGTVALLLTLIPTRALADPNAPGPGGTSFPVIAQGVGAISTDRAAWRVVKDTAQLPGDAEPLERALGFALATDDAVLVTDENTGAQQRLAAAEAAFIPEGAVQRHESLGDAPAPYFRLALVPPEDADFTAGGDLVLAGEPFAAPSGRRDLDLILGNLRSGTTATLSDSGFPTVLLTLTGSFSVGVAEGGGGPTTLAAGEAMVIQGDRKVKATGPNASVFVAAVIGPEIPSSSAQPIDQSNGNDGTGNDGTTDNGSDNTGKQVGSIGVWVYDCPPDVSYQDLTVPYPTGTCTEDPAATFATLTGDNLPGGHLTLDDLTPGEGNNFWSVPYGDYTLATDNSVQVIVDPADALGDTTGNTAILWPLTINADHPNLSIGIYLLH
jgi:hypothetical protein